MHTYDIVLLVTIIVTSWYKYIQVHTVQLQKKFTSWSESTTHHRECAPDAHKDSLD